jgi:hypothetical protein
MGKCNEILEELATSFFRLNGKASSFKALAIFSTETYSDLF